MIIDAAVNGHGIGLARSTLAARDLINRQLVAPFPVSLPLSTAYWIVAPQVNATPTENATFRWLLAEAEVDDKQVSALGATSKHVPRNAAPRVT